MGESVAYVLRVCAFRVLGPGRVHLQGRDVITAAMNLRQAVDYSIMVNPECRERTHHIIVAPKHPISGETASIRIREVVGQTLRKLSEVVGSPLFSDRCHLGKVEVDAPSCSDQT